MSRSAPTDHPNWRPDSVELTVSRAPVDYETATRLMEARVDGILDGSEKEWVWFLEHPPLYTGGTSAKADDLREPERFPVHQTRRGGQYTYHGPGQRVAYVMLDLRRRHQDVRAYVASLEAWLIRTLDQFNVVGETRDDRVGVWVDRSRPGYAAEDKIAAIGVRIRRWVTFHGVALNVEPNLEHFSGITPCGIDAEGLGVTSLVDLGLPVTMDEVDAALTAQFEPLFGPLLRSDADVGE